MLFDAKILEDDEARKGQAMDRDELKTELKKPLDERVKTLAEYLESQNFSAFEEDGMLQICYGDDQLEIPLNLEHMLRREDESKDRYLQELEERFTQPVERIYENLSGRGGYYAAELHEIHINSSIKEDLEQQINAAEDPEDKAFLERVSFFGVSSVESHELQHSENDRAGVYAPGLTQGDKVRIGMLNEVSACMAQASQALNVALTIGNWAGFIHLPLGKEGVVALRLDLDAYFKEHPQEKHRQNIREKTPALRNFLAERVFHYWMEEYNKPGSSYALQTLKNSRGADKYQYRSDAEQQEEFERRARQMFNIRGLGDVSEAIDFKFELDPDIKAQLPEVEKFSQREAIDYAGIVEEMNDIEDPTVKNVLYQLSGGDADLTPEERVQRLIDNVSDFSYVPQRDVNSVDIEGAIVNACQSAAQKFYDR